MANTGRAADGTHAELAASPPEPDNPPSSTSTATGTEDATAAEHVQRFTEYAEAARVTAADHHGKGDAYGESLALTRADVYARAAELVRATPPPQAAEEMMENARRLHVRTPPLTDFDQAGKRYIAARAWQFCANEIDPELAEKAPSWG